MAKVKTNGAFPLAEMPDNLPDLRISGEETMGNLIPLLYTIEEELLKSSKNEDEILGVRVYRRSLARRLHLVTSRFQMNLISGFEGESEVK